MKKYAKLVSAIMAVILTLGIATGCSEKDGLTRINLNEVVHSIFYAPQYVALEKGFFEEEGLEIELSVGQGADKSMTALISGDAQIALLGTEAGIYVYNEGKENYAVSFAQLTQRAGNFLVSREKEENFSWDNLKGKSVIGGRVGGMPQMVLEYILKERGITPGKDVEIINNIAFTSTAGAFAGKVGDYTVEFEPSASALEEQGQGYVVASLGEDSGYVPYTVYMSTKEYIEKNPEIIQSFTNAIYKGQLWVRDHTSKEIAEVIAPHFTESDIDTLTKIIERYKSQDTWKEDPIFEEESLKLIEKIMDMGGELKASVPYEDLVTTEFAEKAVSSIK
ncbi:MAG: ABC transporter substrate-binding protein [Lachnospiraceae bacterium]|nr:ABC transporter substrate-binding protein [Lachnospiraceae bacterium]